MNKKDAILKLFNYSHPLMNTEMYSLFGDKYSGTLPFAIEFVDELNFSDVVLWDGVITAKNRSTIEIILNAIGPNRILLVIGESQTLLENHPLVHLADTKNLNFMELPGWSVLPEEILQKLEECFKKLKHV